MSTIRFTVCLTTSADATVELEISEEKLAELLDGEPFDARNERHVDVITDFFHEGDHDMPRVCASCSGWGDTFSLDIGDEWDVTEIFRKGGARQ